MLYEIGEARLLFMIEQLIKKAREAELDWYIDQSNRLHVYVHFLGNTYYYKKDNILRNEDIHPEVWPALTRQRLITNVIDNDSKEKQEIFSFTEILKLGEDVE